MGSLDILVPSLLNGLTALVCLGFTVMVLARNWRKPTHQSFALLSSTLMLWSLTVFGAVTSHNRESVLAWVHVAEFIVCFSPGTLYQFVGHFPKGRFDGNRPLLVALYSLGLLLALNSLGPWYVEIVSMPAGKPPIVRHHDSILVLVALILLTIFAVHTNLRRKLRESHGFDRRQIQFVLSGCYGIAVMSALTSTIEPLFGIPTFQAYTPAAVMLLMGFFAYAMVRYHLLDTRAMVSRALVYGVATTFVILTFMLFTFVTRALVGAETTGADLVPGILTAFLVTLVFQTIKERVANTIEVSFLRQRYDMDALYARLAQQSAEVVELGPFLAGLAQDIQKTIGVRTIRVLLTDPNDPTLLITEFTSVAGEPPMRTREHAVLLDFLSDHPQPLILEQILHGQPDERMVRVASCLADLEAFFCLPLKTGDGLVGLLTLGPKETHDVYSHQERVAFRALVGPLGTAIANARLYRELAGVHLRQTNVFAKMREGVIAVDKRGMVTVINQAALSLLGPIEEGRNVDELPAEIADLLRTTLDRETPVSDFETAITNPEGQSVTLLMSSSCLMTEDGATSGAVVLLYDLSLIKTLERNVQRADRLSSIGTLAAGMAHEIKNPLVSIKTFTQLLADRYKDPEFRATFEEVVPHEVDRIDTIVSRLLDFARPRPVVYTHVNIRRTIDEVAALIENQLRKAFVTVELDAPDQSFFISGDDQQLHQVFLNLFLNAIDAMKQRGEGTLRIKLRMGYFFKRRKNASNLVERKCVHISVSDTGHGIPADRLPEIFTPFFTTKPEGCGLGLAVVHSIIEEHGGEIDVTSVAGEGATFTVSLPSTTVTQPVEPATVK